MGPAPFLLLQRSRLHRSFALTLPEALHVRRIDRLVRTQAQSAAQQAGDAAITEFEGTRPEPEVPTALLIDSDEERPERVRQARTRPFGTGRRERIVRKGGRSNAANLSPLTPCRPDWDEA